VALDKGQGRPRRQSPCFTSLIRGSKPCWHSTGSQTRISSDGQMAPRASVWAKSILTSTK
jgi:hypothetical protein